MFLHRHLLRANFRIHPSLGDRRHLDPHWFHDDEGCDRDQLELPGRCDTRIRDSDDNAIHLL